MKQMRNLLVVSGCLLILFLGSASAAEFDEKISEYRAELRQNPNNVSSMIQLARYLSWSGRLEESIRFYKKVLTLQPKNVEATIGLANVYSWQKKYSESIRMYKKITKKYPDNVDALTGLARTYSFKGDYKKSIQTFNRAKRFAPDSRGILLGMGRVYSWNKEYKKSEATYKKLLKITPKDVEILKGLANSYKWSKQYTKGIHTELKILRIEPKNVDSMLSIGYMYGELGAVGQSIHWYQKAAKVAPDRGDVQAYLGLLYTRSAQIDSAATAFKKALELQDNDIQSYLSLGRVYSWQSKYEESEDLYRQAIKINPQSAGAYAGLGQLFFYNGMWDKSIRNYRKSLELDPFYVEAIQGLKRVQLLKAPNYTSRYEYLKNDFRDTETNVRQNIEHIHRFSNEFLYKFAPGKSIEGRVRLSQVALNDTDKDIVEPEWQDRDYLYDQYTMSLRLDYPLIKNKLFFQGRYDQEIFSNHGDPGRFKLPDDEYLSAGFSLLRYEWEQFVSILSFSREPLVTNVTPDIVFVDPLDTYGFAAIYDFTDNFSFIGNAFYSNFRKGRGFRDRSDYRGIFQWRLPFFKEIEFSYEIRHINHPNETTNVGSIRFTDRFINNRLLLDLFYELAGNNTSTNYGTTYKNIFRIFNSFKITDWVHINTDYTYQLNKGHDRDTFQTYRAYLTFVLDNDAFTGKYRTK